ncbi:hypothetical protein BGZ67_001660 [Mortierella alpina]|nr:hypothetical protein BGZ67_001660 [Mortierella alpina]
MKDMASPVDEEVFDLKSKSDKELDDMLPCFIQQLGLGKFYVQDTDNGNRPVVYLNVRMHRPGDQNARTMEKMFVYILETGRTLIKPPRETVSLLYDLTGVS